MTLSPPSAVTDPRDLYDPERILSECCQQKTECRFQLLHSGYSTRAIFAQQHPSGLDLHFRRDESTESLLPQAICAITFHYQFKFCAFLSKLNFVQRLPSQELRVIVASPVSLTMTNLRHSFRVPVTPGIGFEVSIQTSDGQSHPVTAHDIAVSGLDFEFATTDTPDLVPGDELLVELRFRNDALHSRAKVRRVNGSRCGVSFGPLDDQDDQKLVTQMNRLVLALQQIWLKNRLN